MKFSVDKKSSMPLYLQIFEQIKRAVAGGALPRGASIPSERRLAESLGVHRNTVIHAYTVLKDEGIIESRPGVGYRITDCRAGGSHESIGEKTRYVRRMNWSHVIRDEYLDMKETFDELMSRFSEGTGISLSVGMPPLLEDEEKTAKDLASIIAENRGRPAFMAPFQGDRLLRKEISAFLREKGIFATPGQIQILQETNQVLDFICSVLTTEGDVVVTEEPVSPDVYRVIEQAGRRCVTLPTDENGMVMDDLENVIVQYKPKFIYVNSSYHDPSGVVLSPERRRRLLEISEKYATPIIEDDAASELYLEDQGHASIKSMDEKGNVVYIYSFSLTFIPGMTIACVAADEKLIRSLRYLASAKAVATNWITQRLLLMRICDGRYRRSLEEMRSLFRRRRDCMCSCLNSLSDTGASYLRPDGGIYIWLKLPLGLSSDDVAAEAMKNGVTVMPGEVFFPRRRGGLEYIRLNYSYENEERIKQGTKIIEKVIRELWKKRQQ